MLYQIFLSPQVKRCAIITYKNGTYELPHELLNDLILMEISEKCLNLINDSLVPSLPAKIKILLILAKKS